MKSLTKKFLVMVSTLFFLNISFAECTSVVRYINGVWNVDDSVSLEISKQLKFSLSNDTRICVEAPLFNPSQSYLTDLAETFALKRVVEEGFWSNLKNGLVSGTISAISNIVASFTGTNPLLEQQKVLDEMYITIKSDLDSNKGVILVSHSEGNLFALRLKQIAKDNGYTDDNKIKIVHLASPTFIQKEIGRNNYLRLNTDAVVNSLLFNKNETNFTTTLDTSLGGHGMLSTYFNKDLIGNFRDFNCVSSTSNTQQIVIDSIKRIATCQSSLCIYIGFSSCLS